MPKTKNDNKSKFVDCNREIYLKALFMDIYKQSGDNFTDDDYESVKSYIMSNEGFHEEDDNADTIAIHAVRKKS